jgi:opacity protein-like surface antigen
VTRRTLVHGSALLLAVLSLRADPCAAEEAAPTPAAHLGLVARGVGGRLTVGARVSHPWLSDDRRSGPDGFDNANRSGNFLGSLWGLDVRQRYVPNPFLEYRIVSAFGVGAAYDQVRVKTLDWGNAERTVTAGDGDLRIRGAQVFAFGRFANRTRVTPYARIGFAYYWSAFFESPGWAVPGRAFEVSDTRGWLVGAGLRIALWRGIALDGSYEHLHLGDVEAAVRFASGGKGTKGAFPMRSDVASLGISYGF